MNRNIITFEEKAIMKLSVGLVKSRIVNEMRIGIKIKR